MLDHSQASPAQAHFDPTAFQLPEHLQHTQGPTTIAFVPFVEGQRLQQQAQRLQSPTQRVQPSPPQVIHNLQKQQNLQQTDERAQRLKKGFNQLKTTLESEPLAAIKAALKMLQSCYSGAYCPKDVATMQVLHPLLKCQAYKWDQLQAQQEAMPPPQEAAYLHKFKTLQGSLGVSERVALLQLIQGINQGLAQYVAASSEPTSEETAPKTATLPSADFDPLQVGRRLLQIRAKLQRTYSETEKTQLHHEIQTLQKQQQAAQQQRQHEALTQSIEEHQQDSKRLPRFSSSHFDTWRKLRIRKWQSLIRLLQQNQIATHTLESAQQQLARLGLADASHWISQTRQSLTVPEALSLWQSSAHQLIDTAEQAVKNLGFQSQQAFWETQAHELKALQKQWQNEVDALQALENEYLQASAETKHKHQESLLQGYAELLVPLVALANSDLFEQTG